MAWMQICEPTDKEKGHYTIEIQDASTSHSRTFDLSGQGKRSTDQTRIAAWSFWTKQRLSLREFAMEQFHAPLQKHKC